MSKTEQPTDRVKDWSDIGEVILPIEKLLQFREAHASCVHTEAALEANRGISHQKIHRK